MKKIKSIALLVSFMLLTSVFFSKSFAATAATVAATDAVHSVNITRTVSDVTNPVTNTFTYTITPDVSNPTGGATGVPATASIAFSAVTPNASNSATQSTALDFTGASFSKLGNYKFKITETASTDSTTYPVSNEAFYVYVQVRNAVDANNVPTGSLVATVLSQGTREGNDAVKTDVEFQSQVQGLSNITLTKNLKGNMANTDEYFKFAVAITGANTGDQFHIKGQDATVTYNGSSVSTSSTYTVGQTNYVYLKAGQTVTIGQTDSNVNQIRAGCTYTITEQDATDYTTTVDGGATATKTSGQKTVTTSTNATTFTNAKEEGSLTGVFFTVVPYALIVLIAIAGFIIVRKLSVNSKEI